MPPQPRDNARLGRLVLASIDGDEQKLAAVVEEALNEDTLLELHDATLFALVGVMRMKWGDAGARQVASDWILKAQMDEDS